MSKLTSSKKSIDKSRRFIRTATINDLLALKRLFIVENHHNAAIAPDVISQTEDVLTEEELREIIADNNQCLLVVDVDGAVVGKFNTKRILNLVAHFV